MVGYGRTVKEKNDLRTPTKVASAADGPEIDWRFPGMALLG